MEDTAKIILVQTTLHRATEKNISLTETSRVTAPKDDDLHNKKQLKIKGEIIQLVSVDSESTDYSMFEKGRKVHLASSCYI